MSGECGGVGRGSKMRRDFTIMGSRCTVLVGGLSVCSRDQEFPHHRQEPFISSCGAEKRHREKRRAEEDMRD